MLGAWLAGMGSGLTGFASFLKDVFNAVIGLFYACQKVAQLQLLQTSVY